MASSITSGTLGCSIGGEQVGMTELKDLRLLMASRYPIILIETWEERRALQLLRRIAMEQGLPVFSWTVLDGLRREEFTDTPSQKTNAEPFAALSQIRGSTVPAIYVMCDLHPFLRDEPKNVRLIKEIALNHDQVGHHLVLLSHAMDLPPELRRYAARCELSMPDDTQLLAIVQDEARNYAKTSGIRVRTDRSSLDKVVGNLRGATFEDARRLARGAIVDDGAITDTDIQGVNKAKFELLNMDGVLSYECDTARFAEVGGLANMRRWLDKRESAFRGDSGDIDAPKGVMLVGVQGGGKSLAAKAVAGMWGLPLLRLDMGAVYNKFFGESERNVRDSLKLAETMAPCVLWIDEIEKGISTGDNDGGTSRRVLGSFLTWMAERKAPVFVVATANQIADLPPELVRKGRFDEIFFVDLPDTTVREDIFRIHLQRRRQEAGNFDLSLLAGMTEGFTGAEIEQVVVAALYSAQAEQVSLDESHLRAEVAATVPLSVTMAESLQTLRQWCAERAVPAN